MAHSDKTLVVAVSGGVDSVVLLHMITQGNLLTQTYDRVIVAHFDHGIRDDSAEDAQFVQKLAAAWGVKCETKRVRLGKNTSESRARKARYEFLWEMCEKYTARLATAHHRDDVIETALINLIRGTHWRGLAPLSSGSEADHRVLRPLLDRTKTEIITYANQHHLQWREDTTNSDTRYFRNYIRQVLLKKYPQLQPTLGQYIDRAGQLRHEIDSCFIGVRLEGVFKRSQFIMLPTDVALEYLYRILRRHAPEWHPTRQQLIRVLHFLKVGFGGKKLEVDAALVIELSRDHTWFIKSGKYGTIAR